MKTGEFDSECDSTVKNRLLEGKEFIGYTFGFLTKLYNGSKTSGKIFLPSGKEEDNNNGETLIMETSSIIYNLSTSTILKIFSYLDVASLYRCSRVCLAWYNISNDELLWEEKLKRDSILWHVIDNLSHPLLYQITEPSLKKKEIYLRCCPEYRKYSSSQLNLHFNFTKLSYYFGLSDVPKVVMFGSGLDTSGLVKRLFWDKRSPFEVKGMFPGQFEGYGSGVTLQHADGTFNLITLYSQPKSLREQQEAVGGERVSKLLVEKDNEIHPVQPVKELCSTVDGFVSIIKASNLEEVMANMVEFKSLIDTRWVQEKAPLLVLCVVPNATIPSVPAIVVADQLKLLNLKRPWQVRQFHANSLYGFMPGITWLTKKILQ